MAKKRTYEISITSAVVLGGEIVTAGRTVAVDGKTARNLLHRGKAELAAGHEDDVADAGGAADQGTDAPLSGHTVAELREFVAEMGIKGAASMRKAELIDAIKAADEEAE